MIYILNLMYNNLTMEINSKDIKVLFSNLCCSHCRNDFTQDSLTLKEKEGDVLICNLKCSVCGKDFGDIVFNYNKSTKIHDILEVIEGPPAINADDVLDIHNFLKNKD